ncbi:MAG: acylphosphatase [Limosilactobacillus sp.]|uniref:acylphosphatase n=1 Tax=Limosilactobacillus sp. TaxID=2773925 RepID=UPI0026F7029C|nr:acylphosphatase [Limosilactobacillus sp.]
MINYQMTYRGRVQGVDFRWGCYDIATHYDVSGFVENLPNGDVYLEVQGEQDVVAEFLDKISQGPTPYARIDHVDQKVGTVKNYTSFTIRRSW